MKLSQLFERSNSIPNPLGSMPDDVYDMMDEFDDIESDYADALHNHSDEIDLHTKIQQTRESINSLGKIVNIEISKLLTMEPDVDPDHLKLLQVTPNNEPAAVYLHKGKYYINDGNHRVAAAHANKQTTIKVRVVNTQDIISKTRQLDIENI